MLLATGSTFIYLHVGYYGVPESGEFTSTVSISRKGSPSVKTTVPSAITKIMKLEHHDKLVWKIEAKEDKFTITVRKKKR